jgi:hypothetical protein
VNDGVVEVVQRHFSLEREEVEGVKTLKGKGGHRPVARCGEPSGTQELSNRVNITVHSTVTVINRNIMNSSCVENAEVCRRTRWASTWETAMAELYTKSKTFESHFLKKIAIPMLWHMREQSR